MRHRILLMGEPGSGKSEAIRSLAISYPDHRVAAFDFQDGLLPLLETVGDRPPNLELFRIEEPDIDVAWPQLKERCTNVRTHYTDGDWICFDMADIPWEMAQRFYVWRKYGMELADYLLEVIVEKDKKVGFSGLSTDDWTLGIRPQYYSTIPRTLGAGCRANVLVTAGLKDVASWMKDGREVFLEAKLPTQYKVAKIKPAGESNLTAQVDVVLQVEHPSSRKWRVRTLGKNRMGVEFDWEDCTDQSIVEVYMGKVSRGT